MCLYVCASQTGVGVAQPARDSSSQADWQHSATAQPENGAGLVPSDIMAADLAFSHGTARKSNKK